MTVHAHVEPRPLVRIRFLVYALGLALALALGYAATRTGGRSAPPAVADRADAHADHEPANPAENR